jgi:hypothetical protein
LSVVSDLADDVAAERTGAEPEDRDPYDGRRSTATGSNRMFAILDQHDVPFNVEAI